MGDIAVGNLQSKMKTKNSENTSDKGFDYFVREVFAFVSVSDRKSMLENGLTTASQ